MSNKTAQVLYIMVFGTAFACLIVLFYNSKEIEMSIYKKALMPLVALFGLSSLSANAEIVSDNMIDNQYFINGSFEGWSFIVGNPELSKTGIVVDGEVIENAYKFMGGSNAELTAIQYDIDLVYGESVNVELIKAGAVDFDFSVLFNSWENDNDSSAATVEFYDHDGSKLSSYNTGWINSDLWKEYELNGDVDEEAISASVTLYAKRYKGSFNNGYAIGPSFNLSASDDLAIENHGALIVSAPAMLGAFSIAMMGLSGFSTNRRKKN